MIQVINNYLEQIKRNPEKECYIKLNTNYIIIATDEGGVFEVTTYDNAGFVVSTEYMVKDVLIKGGYLHG